jgi:MinD-like ATPase involved in chromosome partitioning or flagellar assembly
VTPDRTDETPDDGAEHGVLDDSGSLDTSNIHILGGHIAQVSVDLPVSDEDDVDDDVIEDEMPVIDPESRAFEVVGIVHLPDADEPPLVTHIPDPEVIEVTTDSAELVLEPHDDTDGWDADAEVHEAELEPEEGDEHEVDAVTEVDATVDGAEVVGTETDGAAEAAPEEVVASEPVASAFADVEETVEVADVPEVEVPAAELVAEDEPGAEDVEIPDEDAVGELPASEESREAEETAPEPAAVAEPEAESEPAAVAEPEPESEPAVAEPAEPEPAATSVDDGTAPTTGPVPRTRAELAATGAIGTMPLTRREVHQADEAARSVRVHANERVRTPGSDVSLTSKRLGEIDDARESPDLLTADRLLDPRQISRPEPEGLWQQLVYSVSRHRINLGDGRRARARKDLDRRIAAPLSGEARFVPVLSRKGGVGKTTVTALLGMALADARDDRVIAVDANPDRGTLADRVGRPNGRTVRDLVRAHDDVEGYSDVSSIVARDTTRLDVLASDADPRVSEAFSDEDYRRVADVAAHYYSIVLTDTGTGIVHSVMEATLELADSLVVVAGLSVDEARLASETLTWLETNGYADRVRNAVVVLNSARPGAPLVRESELEAHFRTRVRAVIRMPYDAHVAAGSAIAFRDLQPDTRLAARELAAAVVGGLRVPAAVA